MDEVATTPRRPTCSGTDLKWPLHRLAGVARAGQWEFVRCGADGHRTGIRVLRCAHAILMVPFAIPNGQVFVVDRGTANRNRDAFEQRFKDLVRWWKKT